MREEEHTHTCQLPHTFVCKCVTYSKGVRHGNPHVALAVKFELEKVGSASIYSRVLARSLAYATTTDNFNQQYEVCQRMQCELYTYQLDQLHACIHNNIM